MHRALINGAPAWAFHILAFGRLTDEITTSDLRSLLSAIAAAPDGWDVSVEIVAMRLHSEGGDRSNLDLLFELGCDLLLGIDPSRQSHKRLDFALGALARACLSGERGQSEAAAVCRALADAFERHAASFYDFNELVRGIFRAQPEAALDVFLRRRNDSWHPTVLSMFDDVSGHLPHPLADIEDEIIMNWCIREPDQNFVAAATSIPYSRKSTSDTEVAWTELALRLLEKSPEPSEVLKTFAARFSPYAWSGSRAALIESNAELLLVQEGSENPSLARTARHERKRLLEEAQRERRRESDSSRRENERFE